ncbi:MAG: GspE/PulE family protein [Planctomycetota bacterium]
MSVEHLVNSWITTAYERGASDLHIEPHTKDRVRVRMRVDGQLRQLETADDPRKIMARIKVMAELDVNEKDKPLDGRINFGQRGGSIPHLDLRVSTTPCLGGEKIVMRLIDNRKLSLKLESLGFTNAMLKKYKPAVESPHGLILHVGPTGSGKTTSLYALLKTIHKTELSITTVEDPVEYDVQGITQTNVDHEQGLTFPLVLRAMLRQDPDVIMVGEIRDAETAEIATEAAMTGHLVLSTLHTNDSVGTVVRLMDMGIAPYCIAYAMRCVVSQRFAAKLCQGCKRSSQPPEHIRRILGENRPIYQAPGCTTCGRAGTKGRIPIFEFLPNSAALRQAIYAGATPDALQEVAKKNGLISMWDDARDKVHTGQVSIEEALRVVKGVRDPTQLLKAAARRVSVPKGGARRPGPPTATMRRPPAPRRPAR